MNNTLEEVRDFYNRVGWQQVGSGLYQNARYEDLRPVSQEYIHRCHLRVRRHLKLNGNLLLDAGSGPVQYPEYLTYSDTYKYRVCLDLSIVALQEARKRLGDKGVFVVGDVSRLPFKKNCFDGVVSLHTLHHLPVESQFLAFKEIYRVLENDRTAVVVNGWTDSWLMRRLHWLVRFMDWLGQRFSRKKVNLSKTASEANLIGNEKNQGTIRSETGTFVKKLNARLLKDVLAKEIALDILCWRSVSVRFLRAVIHKALAGRFLLRILYQFEEWFPRWFGEKGQYPLIVIRKGGEN